MKTNYRGFEIDVHKDKCMGGWEQLYFTVMRLEDGWFMIDGFSEGNDTVKEFIQDMKNQVDNYYNNPLDWEDN